MLPISNGSVLPVEKTLDFLRVLDLLLVILPLAFGDGFADLRGTELFQRLRDLAGGEVALKCPVLFAASIGADLCRFAGLVRKLFSNGSRNGRYGLGTKRKIVPSPFYCCSTTHRLDMAT